MTRSMNGRALILVRTTIVTKRSISTIKPTAPTTSSGTMKGPPLWYHSRIVRMCAHVEAEAVPAWWRRHRGRPYVSANETINGLLCVCPCLPSVGWRRQEHADPRRVGCHDGDAGGV